MLKLLKRKQACSYFCCMNKLGTAKYLMITAICTIAAFQGYWLYKLYREEFNNIQKKADVLLRQSVQSLQENNLKTDSNFIRYAYNTHNKSNLEFVYDTIKENISHSPRKVVLKGNPDKKNFKDSSSQIAYMSIHTSKTLNKGLMDSILQKIRPEQIGTIEFNKDSFSRKTNTIIINSKHPGNLDSILSGSPGNKIKDTMTLKPPPFRIKLDCLGVPKPLGYQFNLKKSYNGSDTSKALFSNLLIKFFSDSIDPKKVDSVFKETLLKEKMALPFQLFTKRVAKEGIDIIDTTKKTLHTSSVNIGFVNPMAYQARFDNPFLFIVKRIGLPIGISLFLLSFVTLAFIVMYKNMMAQNKLTSIKNEFISNITHELKTPIATVNVAVEALKNFNALDDKKKTEEYLNISALEISRLSLLVDNVLKLSMFENNKIELQKEDFDVIKLLDEVLAACSIQLQKANIEVNKSIGEEAIFLHADRLHITSIFFNLIDNAIKYSAPDTTISISIKKSENNIVIKIKDEGLGIAKENSDKIFTKFYRISNNNIHNVKGYGLGLSYVKYIVDKHNGTITVDSILNKGTTFTIQLPC